MLKFAAVLFLGALLAGAQLAPAPAPSGGLAAGVTVLRPGNFSSINWCLPVSGLVTAGPNYEVQVQADSQVRLRELGRLLVKCPNCL